MNDRIYWDLFNSYQTLYEHTETESEDYESDELVEFDEEIDYFDDVVEYLIYEGYASDYDSASVIMANMGESWRNDILFSLDEARKATDNMTKEQITSRIQELRNQQRPLERNLTPENTSKLKAIVQELKRLRAASENLGSITGKSSDKPPKAESDDSDTPEERADYRRQMRQIRGRGESGSGQGSSSTERKKPSGESKPNVVQSRALDALLADIRSDAPSKAKSKPHPTRIDTKVDEPDEEADKESDAIRAKREKELAAQKAARRAARTGRGSTLQSNRMNLPEPGGRETREQRRRGQIADVMSSRAGGSDQATTYVNRDGERVRLNALGGTERNYGGSGRRAVRGTYQGGSSGASTTSPTPAGSTVDPERRRLRGTGSKPKS